MSNLVHQTKLFLHRNASTILTGIGGVGVVATAVMAAKETPKALALLEKAKDDKGEELTAMEKVKIAAPAYIPAILTGTGTIACIFGANLLNKHQQAALMSAYALLDNSYKEYRSKTEELYGEDAGTRIRGEIAKDKYDEEEVEVDSDKQLFYDYFSDRYFESTIAEVQRAEYVINRHLVMRDYAYVNEFYEELGIEPIESGYEYGWTPGANLDRYWQAWVDFSHEKVVMDDGLECIIIVMNGEPILDFENYC